MTERTVTRVSRHEVVSREAFAPVIAGLAAWDAGGGYVPLLHAGDLGWLLRLPDELIAGKLHCWWDGDELVAVSLVDGVAARPRIRDDLLFDLDLATEVADVMEQMPGDQVWCDAAPGTKLRQELVRRGWQLDPDPWVSLHAVGSRWQDGDRGDVRLSSTMVEGRVSAQRNGFERSTFDEPSWHRMAAGPSYRPDLDLVVLDGEQPAAAATGWLSVPGGTAILEPLATHRDHRGRGFGRAAAGAVVDACLAAGASGVSVATPASNEAAVATYVAAGFRPVEAVQALTLERNSGGS